MTFDKLTTGAEPRSGGGGPVSGGGGRRTQLRGMDYASGAAALAPVQLMQNGNAPVQLEGGPPLARVGVSARAMQVTPEEKDSLSAMTCWTSAVKCMELAGVITGAQFAGWGNDQGAASNLAGAGDTVANQAAIPDNQVVCIYRKFSADGAWVISHVMLSAGGSMAIGSNNGCLGGSPAWSVLDLGSALTWSGRGNPTYEADAGAPDWAKERMVCYAPANGI